MLGKPVGPSTQTLGKKVMTFACICVELDLSRPLPDVVEMCAGSHSWMQQLDYETLPFRCHLFHEYGHLLRTYPKAKSVEQQSSPPSRYIPGADKGRSLLLVRVRMLMVLFRLRLKIGIEAKSTI